MKRDAIDHPKTYDLMRTLGCPRYCVVGILESLWHFTAKFAPDGDVSRFSDSQIAGFIGWEGNAKTLFDALQSTGWIDESRCIHDWSEHADRAVHHRLARAGRNFANGSNVNTSRLSQAERVRLPCARNALNGRTAGAHVRSPCTPPEPEPEPTTVTREASTTLQTTVSSESSSSASNVLKSQAAAAASGSFPASIRTLSTLQQSSSSNELLKLAYELSEKHPRAGSVAQAIRAIESLGYSDELGARLRRMHAVYVEHYATVRPVFVPDLARWIGDGDWRREPEIPKKKATKDERLARIREGIEAQKARKARNGC